MRPKKLSLLLTILPMIITAAGCHTRQESEVNITPHRINLQADSLYQQAIALMESSYDVDSAQKCIRFLDSALVIDSLNPDYYGVKAKLLSEMGELDSALYIQTLAVEKKAITGEYLFQLGLLQAAKDMHTEAHESFGKSKLLLQAVLKQYPDSLGAFILAEAANSLYQDKDSLFMRNIDEIRRRFPERLLEIEIIRRVKPHSLVKQIKKIHIENKYNIDFDLDSLVNETGKQ
ncbi:tetratricopeptide repeat protein [Bacteroides sp. AN502(2024)]|uniref:tetratricopeptide repeat protein n=1 Tax=Bacteroides sp. AN502(2024) TaxID=3160599 RepID=UPI003516BA0B